MKLSFIITLLIVACLCIAAHVNAIVMPPSSSTSTAPSSSSSKPVVAPTPASIDDHKHDDTTAANKHQAIINPSLSKDNHRKLIERLNAHMMPIKTFVPPENSVAATTATPSTTDNKPTQDNNNSGMTTQSSIGSERVVNPSDVSIGDGLYRRKDQQDHHGLVGGSGLRRVTLPRRGETTPNDVDTINNDTTSQDTPRDKHFGVLMRPQMSQLIDDLNKRVIPDGTTDVVVPTIRQKNHRKYTWNGHRQRRRGDYRYFDMN